jgi:hypothetical protein
VDEDAAEETIQGLGWGRWKRLFVRCVDIERDEVEGRRSNVVLTYSSFRAPDGTFPEPQATVPHPLDGDDEEEPDQ